MSNIPLGKLLEGNEARDAIHIAIAPVIAGEKLKPGQTVGFIEKGNCEVVGGMGEPIGIVDPFLDEAVKQGERFWLLLFPNTITSLRHDWAHPAFHAENKSTVDEANAKAWIETYASTFGLSYGELVESAIDYLDRGDYLSQGGRFEGEYICAEFWDYFQRATGRMVDLDDRGSFFSCSC